MDLTGGSNYEKVSTTQMLPVPYALYAAKAGEVEKEGNGGVVSDIPKFTFVVADIHNTGDDLYGLLSGELYKEGSVSYDGSKFYVYDSISIECTILYLDGQDQELMISIEGLSPETEDRDYEIGQSSCAGRMFDMCYINVPDGKYKLIVSDKNGKTVKEYPFTFKAQRSL